MKVLHILLTDGREIRFTQPNLEVTQKHKDTIVHDSVQPFASFRSTDMKAWWFTEEEEAKDDPR